MPSWPIREEQNRGEIPYHLILLFIVYADQADRCYIIEDNMLRKCIVMTLIYTLSVVQAYPYPSFSHTVAQIMNHLRNIDQDLTDIKVTVTENERRIDTRKIEKVVIYHFHAGHTRKASRMSKAAVDNCGKGVGNFYLS